jgi:hypothetical protein
MKQLLSTYSIAGNVVTLTGVNRPLEAILSITDSTTGAILYTAQTGGASAYSQGTNSTITLTSAPGASDRLQIFYDDGVAPSNAPTSVSVSNFPATQPVSGTFWQATQPVSLSSLPSLAAGANSIGAINNTGTQFSRVAISTATLTRPANTTAYGANTVVSNSTSAGTVITFSNVLPVNQGDGYIVAVRAMTNQTAFAAALRLHLYKTSPDASVVLNDAAAFKLMLADVNNRIGYVDLSGWTTGGTGSDAATAFGIFPGSGASLPLELASASTTLFGVVETRAAFTPASGQQFVFSLKTQLA